MKDNNIFILSDKYQLIRSLGKGSFSQVFLARHQSLQVDRAIKIIPKTALDHLIVLSEARLLKSMHHPGIPMIYDIEEDQDNYYLVEEFISGESIEEYLFHQRFISLDFFITCCMQLIDIFQYLHSFLPYPVFYQDLKPAHIIVCGNQIKLIDFGATSSITSLGNNFKQFGNVEFSAPEHLSCENTSVQSDVFSIGKFMEFLSSYLEIPPSKSLQHIIQKATEQSLAARYETVEQLSLELQKFYQKISQSHLCKKIAVVGCFPGCGATHIAFSVTSTCNFYGWNAIYYEENPDHLLCKLPSIQKNFTEKDGYVFYRTFCGLPKYGPGVFLKERNADIKIYDYGTNLRLALASDVDEILLIYGNDLWHYPMLVQILDQISSDKSRIRLICNLADSAIAKKLAKEFSLPVSHFPYEKDPFLITRKSISFTEQLLAKKGRNSIFSRLKKIVTRFRKV